MLIIELIYIALDRVTSSMMGMARWEQACALEFQEGKQRHFLIYMWASLS